MAEQTTERVAALLKTDQGITCDKIAETLGVSKSAAQRAVTKLRDEGRARTRRGPPAHGGGVYAAGQ